MPISFSATRLPVGRSCRTTLKSFCWGNDAGVKEIADELGVQHLPNLKRNDLGTPMLDSVFQLAHQHASAPTMMYLNSDIILNRSIEGMLDAIEGTAAKQFLAIGQRRDFDQNEPLNFDAEWGTKN